MEIFKNNLILEMTSLRENILQNRSLVMFLIQNDHILQDKTIIIIERLHSWPLKLTQLVDEVEEKHTNDKGGIETELVKRKEEVEKMVEEFEINVQEVA